MGLQKDVERGNNGVVLGYWHLAQIVQRLDAKQVEVTFHPFVSEAAYKTGKKPAGAALQYTLLAGDFPEGTNLNALTTRMLYATVKAKAGLAAMLPRDRNETRLPEVNGVPTDPALAGAVDVGVG
jgi:hypothetical protein